MNSVHGIIVVIGLILIVAVAYPLGELVSESLGNPDMITLVTGYKNGSLEVTLRYNSTVRITGVKLSIVLKSSNGTTIEEAASRSELKNGENITILIPLTSQEANLTLVNASFSGSIEGVFPFNITYEANP